MAAERTPGRWGGHRLIGRGHPRDHSGRTAAVARSRRDCRVRERSRIVERVKAVLQRARAPGRRLTRPFAAPEQLQAVEGLAIQEAAAVLGVSWSTTQRWLALCQGIPTVTA